MSSALSITRSVNPPRAAFVDYPLGHTTGRPHEPELQRSLLLEALAAFESLEAPGGIVTLPHAWAEDDEWKERVMRPDPNGGVDGHVDERAGRSDAPQYQCEDDRRRAEHALAAGGCETCFFLAEG